MEVKATPKHCCQLTKHTRRHVPKAWNIKPRKTLSHSYTRNFSIREFLGESKIKICKIPLPKLALLSPRLCNNSRTVTRICIKLDTGDSILYIYIAATDVRKNGFFLTNCISLRVEGVVHLSRLHRLCCTGFTTQLGSKISICYYQMFGCKEI